MSENETEGLRPPLFVIKGDASAEEVAALTAVIHGMAAAAASNATPPRKPRPEWAAPHRLVRSSLHAGPGGWRSSALPR